MGKLLISIVVLASFVSLKEGSKYDSKYNIPDIDDENPFRMRKMNLIWEKANRSKRLDEKQMADLFSDLIIHDKKEKELKHMKADGSDKDGLQEASVRRELNDLLKKYQLLEHFPEEKYKPNKKQAADPIDLTDTRLKSLLSKAQKEGFSGEELATLQEELSHHQMKLDEFSALKDEYNEKYKTVDNSLERLDEQQDLWKELHEKNKNLKQKHKALQEDLKKLQHKAKRTPPQFEDPRVVHLWSLAQKSGMGENELESIEKELTHFENRIKKAAFVRDQLTRGKQKMQSLEHVSDGHLEETQKEMLMRAQHIENLVEKHHRDIKEKIQKRLDEL